MKGFGWIEKAGEKVLHVVEAIPPVVMTVSKLLFTGQKIAPEVKTAVEVLVTDGEAVSVAVLAAVASKGANWIADASAVAAVEKFAQDFSAQIPVFENAIKAIEGAVQS